MIFITLSRIAMSNQSLVGIFESLIHKDWQLPQEAGYWLITETAKGATHTEVKIGGCKSIAFSLDITEKNAWPFLTSSLDGLRAVCDSIVIAEYNKQNFCIFIDLKSSLSDKTKAIKQIRSSYLLQQWLINLLSLHAHWPRQKPITYAGIISLEPRQTVPKGTTSKRNSIPKPESFHFHPKHIFTLTNHPRIVLSDLIQKLQQTTL